MNDIEDEEQLRNPSLPTLNDDYDSIEHSDRSKNQTIAINKMEEEKNRRISELEDKDQAWEIEKLINVELSIAAAENERGRRMAENSCQIVREHLLRSQQQKVVSELQEEERLRRIKLVEKQQLEDAKERKALQKQAILDMERERERRVSTVEHNEKMACISPRSQKNNSNFLFKNDSQCSNDDEKESAEMTTNDDDQNHVDDGSEVVELNEIVCNDGYLDDIAHKNDSSERLSECEAFENEVRSLQEMRKVIASKMGDCSDFKEFMDDIHLLRFLRGNDCCPNKAAQKFQEMIAFRKKLGLDKIRNKIMEGKMTMDSFPEYSTILKFVPFVDTDDILDINSNLMFILRCGYIDAKGLLESVSDEEWEQFFAYELEYISIQLHTKSVAQSELKKCNLIFDFSGFSLQHITPGAIRRLQKTVSIATKCYPETANCVFLLNTSWIFQNIWKVVKLWFNEYQMEKFYLDKSETRKKLNSIISEDKLPVFLGGTSTCYTVHRTGLLSRSSYEVLVESGGVEVEISAGTFLQLPFNVGKDDVVCWEFEVQMHDIEFGVYFRTQGDGGAIEENVVQNSRFKCGTKSQGSWKSSSSSGTVVLCWSNKYSWRKSKNVAYKAKIAKEITDEIESIDLSDLNTI